MKEKNTLIYGQNVTELIRISDMQILKVEDEHLIQSAISALTHEKTIIAIAHRLATIEQADQILIVENGRIAQKGTHKMLLLEEDIHHKFIQIRESAEGWNLST